MNKVKRTIYERFSNSCLLPLGDRITGHAVSRRFRELVKWQWSERGEIESFRLKGLRHLIRFAFDNVPSYRRDLLAANFTGSAVDRFGFDDLLRLPILTKAKLRDESASLCLARFEGRIHEMRSSGSTGLRTRVFLDDRCFAEVYATQLLFWSWGGFCLGARHLQFGIAVDRGPLKRIKDSLFRCSYASALDLTDDKLAQVVSQLRQRRIRYLFGYSSSIFVLANYLARRDQCWELNAVFTWGDSLFPHYRALIEAVFQCKVNDCYGMGEGLQIAAQCEEHDALHEAMHGVIVEIVDANGAPCGNGQLGRVVVTRLEPGPMPLIRYDTGDVASFLSGECGCGRALRRISRIQGRATDIVSTPGDDRLIVHFFTEIFAKIPEIAQFQVRQEIESAIEIFYVPSSGFHGGILSSVDRRIRENCRYPIGIAFREVDEIPLEKSNKRRFVISKVPFGATVGATNGWLKEARRTDGDSCR